MKTTPRVRILDGTLSSDEDDFMPNRSANHSTNHTSRGVNSIGDDDYVQEIVHSSDEETTEQPNEAVLEENSSNSTSETILFRKFFRILGTPDEKKNVTAMCLACSSGDDTIKFRGSLLVTSNFVRHLKVIFNLHVY